MDIKKLAEQIAEIIFQYPLLSKEDIATIIEMNLNEGLKSCQTES